MPSPSSSSLSMNRHPSSHVVSTVEIADNHDDGNKKDNHDDNDSLVDPLHETGGTITAAILGIIKAMVGPAILYLPSSFANAGYAFALLALSITLTMYLYASSTLLSSWRHVMHNTQQQQEQQQQQPKTKCTEKDMIGVTTTKEEATKDNDEIEMTSLTIPIKRHLRQHNMKDHSQVPSNDDTNEHTVYDDDDNTDNDDEYQLYSSVDGLQRIKQGSGHHRHLVTYPQLAYMAYGPIGEIMVRMGICLMQLGICLTYFIFVPHNFTASVTAFMSSSSNSSPDATEKPILSLSAGLMIMMVLEIPLCWIRDIRKLVHTNVAANILISFGLLSCLYLAMFVATVPVQQYDDNNTNETEQPTSSSLVHLSPWNDQWYLFIGTAVLLFEGSITLCLPLQQALDVPDAATKFPDVYQRTITGIVIFYSFFGMICWTAFGDTVNTVLTVSLPDGVLATLVQLLYSIAVIFTFPLQIFPATEIVVHVTEKILHWYRQNYQPPLYMDGVVISEPTEDPHQHPPPLTTYQRRALIVMILVVLATVAVAEMNNLGRVVSLMGSLLGCPLAFVFPPLIHNRVVPGAPLTLNYIVAGLGTLAMVGATTITLVTWNDDNGRER